MFQFGIIVSQSVFSPTITVFLVATTRPTPLQASLAHYFVRVLLFSSCFLGSAGPNFCLCGP